MITKVNRNALLILSLLLFATYGKAQEFNQEREYKRFPYMVGLQFQNFTIPFRDLGSHFSHPGLFVGTEYAYNSKGTLFQNVTAGGYLNREIGNGAYINTQIGFRPKITSSFYGELKLGIGYLRIFHPTPTYEYTNGDWQKIIGGKSQVSIPLDLGFGYSFTTNKGEFSPSLHYQINPSLFYNTTLPLNIYTNIMLGLKVKLLK